MDTNLYDAKTPEQVTAFWFDMSITVGALTFTYLCLSLYLMHRAKWSFDRLSSFLVFLFILAYSGKRAYT